jgi:hypothetical protein
MLIYHLAAFTAPARGDVFNLFQEPGQGHEKKHATFEARGKKHAMFQGRGKKHATFQGHAEPPPHSKKKEVQGFNGEDKGRCTLFCA